MKSTRAREVVEQLGAAVPQPFTPQAALFPFDSAALLFPGELSGRCPCGEKAVQVVASDGELHERCNSHAWGGP